MTASVRQWNGTDVEMWDLQVAVQHYCTCPQSADEAPGAPCPAHKLFGDQSTMDHLVYGKRLLERWTRGEWSR